MTGNPTEATKKATGGANPTEDQALILIGHGSLRSASGASMIRIAARLRARGVAAQVEAAFLNYSRPTLAEVVEKVVANGAQRMTVQPYFLIAGTYVQHDLRALVAELAEARPSLRFAIAPVLGEHPAPTELATARARAALSQLDPTHGAPYLLLMAHGTPTPAANAPLYPLAAAVADRLGATGSTVAFLDCNTPTIPDALAELAECGVKQVIALPYFLHLGRHVAQDLPALIEQARHSHPALHIVMAQHLDYDLRLVDAVAALAQQAVDYPNS
jgi:sirohydrochlorin cobaltochelatase